VALFAEQAADNAAVIAAAWDWIFGCNFWGLTIDTFCDLAAGKCDTLTAKATEDGELTVYGLALIKDFKRQAEAFGKLVERLSPPADAAERTAAEAVKLTMFENMAFFARDFFGLRSFEAASKVSLNEWLMARKAKYAAVMVERAMIKEHNKRLKR
jgi:hypothetical protein